MGEKPTEADDVQRQANVSGEGIAEEEEEMLQMRRANPEAGDEDQLITVILNDPADDVDSLTTVILHGPGESETAIASPIPGAGLKGSNSSSRLGSVRQSVC